MKAMKKLLSLVLAFAMILSIAATPVFAAQDGYTDVPAGSIELAPILGLSDVIVDIVETGTTLKENNLRVLTEFMPISARFIANRASFQFKNQEIETLLEKLAGVTGQ